MKLLLFAVAVFTLSGFAWSETMNSVQLRNKISQEQCAPVTGYEDKAVPCYNFKTKKVVDPKYCGRKLYAHCCVFNCTCIVKGAGSSTGIIPEQYRLPQIVSPIKKTQTPARLVKGCIPDPPPGSKASTSEPETRDPEIKNPTLKQKPTLRKPASKPTIKRPVRKPKPKKPRGKRPTGKRPVIRKPGARKPPAKKLTMRRPKPAVRKPSARKPGMKKPTGQKPKMRKPTGRRPPVKKPTARKPPTRKPYSRKPPTRKPTTTKSTKSTKKPCVKTKAPTKPSLSLDFFSRMAFMMNNMGFNSEVVANDPCA